MTLVEIQVKWSVILMDRFGPDNFSTLQIKGHVLHRARAHLKVAGWLLVWNALLTKKLPMFLSRLNEITGGCEKIPPVSGSFWSNLSFLERWILLRGCRVKCEGEWNSIIILLLRRLYCWLPINLLGAIMARLNNRSRITTFVEEMAHFPWF